MHVRSKLVQRFLLALAACVVSLSSPAASVTRTPDLSVPMPGNLDARIRTYAYTPDVVYTLPVTVGMHTHVQLGSDERLVELPRLGETVQWRVTGNARNLYIKALRADIRTSLTLVTSKRVYQFELRSTTQPGERIQKAVFNYPDDEDLQALSQSIEMATTAAQVSAERRQEERARQEARKEDLAPAPVDAHNLSFYRVEGKEPFSRMHVYDDGVMTWMRMPRGTQDAPAVFEVDHAGKLMPVNYTWADRKDARDPDVIIVDRIASKWMLKLGQHVEIKVTRD